MICPFDAIAEKRKGFAAIVGGREGEDTRLGEVIAEFLSEEEVPKAHRGHSLDRGGCQSFGDSVCGNRSPGGSGWTRRLTRKVISVRICPGISTIIGTLSRNIWITHKDIMRFLKKT